MKISSGFWVYKLYLLCILFIMASVSARANTLCPYGTVGCGTVNRPIVGTSLCELESCYVYFGGSNAYLCEVGGDKCCVGPDSIALCEPSRTPNPSTSPTSPPFAPFEPPTNETFNAVNPLNIGGGNSIDQSVPSQYKDQLSTPGGIISRALTFIFPIAGLLLFALLVWGGFEMLAGSPTKKSMESGKNRITAALAGFLLLFAAYWIWQIVEVIFGVAIL